MAYPFLQDFIHVTWLPIPTFGTMVAVAYFCALTIFQKEIDRMVREGVLTTPNVQRITTDMAFLSLISGMVGARVFSILEEPSAFFQDPWGTLFSRGGLAIFGGVIFSVLTGVMILVRKRIPVRPVLDAAAPALMVGYALGRIGCQLSGDGDWGIASNISLKPAWVPMWFWAQTYEHNVIGRFIPPPGVYPTPFYETVAALILFAVLWAVRKHKFARGWLFCFYLWLSGVERFFIEKIRVNVRYSVDGFQFTQAELISVVFFVLGSIGLVYMMRGRPSEAQLVARIRAG